MPQLFNQGYALVVGVGADLPNTVNDAIGFGNILIDTERCAYPRSQVKLLQEGEANKASILAELEKLARSAGTDASVIIYFSGHGYTVPTPTGPVYYLMANGYDLHRLDATAISNREFTDKLCAIRSQKLMVVLDCCHAGGMGEIGAKAAGLEMTKAPLPPDAAEVFTRGSGRVLLASSKASELSFAGKPYSVFTVALIEALSGNGTSKQDGYVRWLDLALYTREAVTKRTKERQHPVADFSQSDNFEIAYYAAGGTQTKGLPFDQVPEIETEPGSGSFEPLHAPLRSQFAPLIEDRTRLFGGRRQLFHQIGQFIADPVGGYLVVTALAGFGKTTLMANLVNRTPQAFAYHFFSPIYSSESLNEDFFLRNVVEQMAQWHGRKEQLPERLDELRALYQQFLAEPLERTQVLVLDGLDEVRGWRLAPYLSRQLPPNLHLVLTVRDYGQDWRGDYGLPAGQVTHLPLEGLTRDDVVQVLKAAGQSAAAFVDEPQLLDEVMRVSAYPEDATLGADPFYVRILVEDIASRQLKAETLSQHPPGLNAYLDKWWQDIRTSAGDTPTRDLFGTLAVALGPIARTDLEALNPSLVDSWDADFFQGVVSKVQRFIFGDDERGYALIHPRLRQYMRSKIKNTQDYLDKLLAYCADWQRHRSPYALTYYVRHLARAAQALTDPSQRPARRKFEDALDYLIVTSKFYQEVIELFHSPQPFFDDLRLGLELALDEEDLVQAWRYVARYRQVLQDERRPDRVMAEVGASNYDAALDRTALYGSLPNSQGMMRLWIAWCAAAAEQTEIATQAASLALRSLPASGFVSKAAEVADPGAAYTIRDAMSTTLQRLLLRLTWAITDTRAGQAVWLRQVAATWPPQVVDALSRRLDESPATWIGEFSAPVSNIVLDDLLDSLTATMADDAMNFREVAFGYQRELATALYQERTNPSWQMRVEQVVRKLSLDDYPSYREMALAWIAAAVLCHDDGAEARRALSTILTGALGIPEPGFGGDTVVAVLEGLAQESGKILKTDGLADVLKHTPAAGTTKEMTQIDLDIQADLLPDPWAFDLLCRNAVAAALHRQGRQSEAEFILEQAGNIGLVGSYAGYRVLARLSLACRWLQWGKPDRARDLLALSRPDADNMLDKVLGAERMGLIDALTQWIADFEQRAPQLLGDSTAVDSVGALTGMKRSLRIQFLAALWSQSPMSLKWLVPLALADTTSLDSVLGRLFASSAVQGLPGQPFHRLVSEMGVLHLADTFVVNR